jgi:hypothetical protein
MRHFANLLLIGGIGLVSAGAAYAQAPPGPLQPPPPSASASSEPAPPPVRKIQPRKSIYGDWKLNREDSDDPRSKMRQAKARTGPDPSTMGGPRVGWPGGGGGMGGYGGNHPNNYPQGNSGEINEKIASLIDPSIRLNLTPKEPKNAQVELTGDQGKKLIFYTDGQKPEQPSDPNQQMIPAKWDGSKLVTDEDLAKNGKLSRTFELSEDGLQLLEEVHLDTGKKKDAPVTIRYVYDAVSPDHAG